MGIPVEATGAPPGCGSVDHSDALAEVRGLGGPSLPAGAPDGHQVVALGHVDHPFHHIDGGVGPPATASRVPTFGARGRRGRDAAGAVDRFPHRARAGPWAMWAPTYDPEKSPFDPSHSPGCSVTRLCALAGMVLAFSAAAVFSSSWPHRVVGPDRVVAAHGGRGAERVDGALQSCASSCFNRWSHLSSGLKLAVNIALIVGIAWMDWLAATVDRRGMSGHGRGCPSHEPRFQGRSIQGAFGGRAIGASRGTQPHAYT